MATLTAAGNLLANNDQVRIDTGDVTAMSATVTVPVSFVGTITFQVLYDTAEGWVSAPCFTRAGVSATAVLTAAGNRFINTVGTVAVRALLTPYTSGGAEVTFAGVPCISVAAASGGGGGGGPVTAANPGDFVDGWDATQGAKADAAAGTDTGTFSAIALFKRLLQKLTTQLPAALGGTTSANSLPVVLSSDGPFATQTGSITEAAPASDTASSGLNGRLQRIAQRLTSLIALLPTALVSGRLDVNVGATVTPANVALDATVTTTNTQIGGLTETAPATDTASSGTNGRLQRLAQRLTSLIALLPTALISNRLDVNLGAAPASLTIGTPGAGPYPTTGFAPAAPTCTFTRGANQTPYTIGDEVGTAGTAPTTISVARANGASGIIQGAQVFLSEYPATIPQLVLLVFSATVTLAGDNAQLNLSDAHAKLLVAEIPLTASLSSQYSAGAPVTAGGVWLSGTPVRPASHFVCGGSEQTLYACLITLNAFTPTANSTTLDVYLDAELN